MVVEEGERRAERTFDGDVLRPAGLELLRACLSTRLGSHLAEEAARLLAAPEGTEVSADLLLGPALVSALIARTVAPSLEVPRMLDGWCGSDAATRVGSTIVGLSDIDETTLASPALSLELDPEGARFDAEGAPYDRATREEMTVVRDGRLVAGLGGAIARHEGVVPTLSALGGDGWEVPTVRPTLRLVPGEDSWPQLLARVESGYWVEGPAWFSFDAARDRGWVGGEWGRRIENGEPGALVRRPAFRYDSATFWPALRAVGDASQRVVRGLELDEWESFEAASPTALFGDVSFGFRPSSGGA